MSIATLADNIREAIKLRVGGYKKLNSSMTNKKELKEKLERKGEGRTVYVRGHRIEDASPSGVGVTCCCGVGVLRFAGVTDTPCLSSRWLYSFLHLWR